MANPQLENGYLKISTELFEALAGARLPGESRQVLDVIIRKTYGYNKKSDDISTSQFMQATGLNRLAIRRATKRLRVSKMILGIKNDTTGIISYSIQKDYDKWLGVSKMIPGIKNVSRGYQKRYKRGIKNEPHNIYKDNIQKTHGQFESFWSLYPRKVSKQTALKAFLKLSPNDELLQLIIKGVEIQSKTDQWQKDNGQFIPHPATWLNQRRWEDEIKKTNDPYSNLPNQKF